MTYVNHMSAKPTLGNDPVAEAFANAPVSSRPISDEERAKVSEGRAAIDAGEVLTQEEVELMLAEKRRKKGA